MSAPDIIFDDAAGYERYMSVWSQKVGIQFLTWLQPDPGLRWLDVGCGNGAFTELIAQHCAPSDLAGIDPSESQLRYARSRPACRGAKFERGDAMALPYAAAAFDVAVMPLVLFFVPEPKRGVAELARVVRSGGIVSSYSWDMLGAGFPYAILHEEMQAAGVAVPVPPSLDASRMSTLATLWSQAGLADVQEQVISVERTYRDFEEYWQIVQGGPSAGRQLAAMTPPQREALRARLQQRLGVGAQEPVTYRAAANAIRGVKR